MSCPHQRTVPRVVPFRWGLLQCRWRAGDRDWRGAVVTAASAGAKKECLPAASRLPPAGQSVGGGGTSYLFLSLSYLVHPRHLLRHLPFPPSLYRNINCPRFLPSWTEAGGGR